MLGATATVQQFPFMRKTGVHFYLSIFFEESYIKLTDQEASFLWWGKAREFVYLIDFSNSQDLHAPRLQVRTFYLLTNHSATKIDALYVKLTK